MRKLSLLIPLFVFLFSPAYSYASVIFQDDFNSYSDDSFPSKWTLYSQPPSCSAQWKVQGGILKISIPQTGCNSHIVPNGSEWPNMLNSYIFDVDVRFISGTDRHFSYRINPQTGFIHVMHFAIPGSYTIDADNQNYLTFIPKTYLYNITYHFKIYVTSNRIKVYESDQNNPSLVLTRDLIFNTPIPPGMIGLGSNPGSNSPTETWFDNVKVTTIDDQNTLSVPSLKQNDPSWGNQLYDSANLWSSGSTDISSYGCALTSAAMVFEFNGIKKLPNGEVLNPGTLNTWLKGQSDGYVRNGLVNWLALSRLSMQAKSNNDVNFDALEYSRIGHQDDAILATNLNQNISPILEEPGHFVVATGTDSANTSFFINDPFYSRTTLANSSYNKTYSSMGIYTPSPLFKNGSILCS